MRELFFLAPPPAPCCVWMIGPGQSPSYCFSRHIHCIHSCVLSRRGGDERGGGGRDGHQEVTVVIFSNTLCREVTILNQSAISVLTIYMRPEKGVTHTALKAAESYIAPQTTNKWRVTVSLLPLQKKGQ